MGYVTIDKSGVDRVKGMSEIKALILNCGPKRSFNGQLKCLMELSPGETILSRQLRLLCEGGVERAAIVSNGNSERISTYCGELNLPMEFTFFDYRSSWYMHYVYGMFVARKYLVGNMLLMHSNLVFEKSVLDRLMACRTSCMAVSTTAPPREEVNWVKMDGFRAYIRDGRIVKASKEAMSRAGEREFDSILPAWRFYRLRAEDLKEWMKRINRNCNHLGLTGVPAEDTLPVIDPVDIGDLLCTEPDNPDDAEAAFQRLKNAE